MVTRDGPGADVGAEGGGLVPNAAGAVTGALAPLGVTWGCTIRAACSPPIATTVTRATPANAATSRGRDHAEIRAPLGASSAPPSRDATGTLPGLERSRPRSDVPS